MRGEMAYGDPLLVRWRALSRKDRDAILASFPAERRPRLEQSLHRFEIEAEAQEWQERDSMAGHSPWLASLIEEALANEECSPAGIKAKAKQALLDAHEAAEQSGTPLSPPSLVELLIDLFPRFRGAK
jgi:hypothetical protein